MQLVTRTPWAAYWQLARMDKPIGTLLLLWPTLWALWLASAGQPDWWALLVFTLGVFLMRSAGCVINDYADRHVDGHVKRTAQRPLPAGRLTTRQALLFFAALVGLSFLLVLTCVPGLSTGAMREMVSYLAVDGSTMKALPPRERLAAGNNETE